MAGDNMGPALCNLLFCNNVQAERGKYNLEGIFFRIHALGYPCRHRCFVVVGWCGDSGSHSFMLRFLTPDKSRAIFETPPHPFTLSRQMPYFNGVVEVALTVENEGAYWIEVLLDGQCAGFFPVLVETLAAGAIQGPA